ncbi:hypothetical protein V8E36_006918 [Tilletia maclaganii]
MFAFDVGKERDGCSYETKVLRHSLASMLGLAEILPTKVSALSDMPKTLVYVNTRAETRRGVAALRKELPARMHKAVRALSGNDTNEQFDRILEKLRAGSVRIIVCTEALGMGIDLPDIDLVVQWRLPRDFKELVQHFGRAARGQGSRARALLLFDGWVETMIKEQGSNSMRRSYAMTQNSQKWDKLDPQLRQWLLSANCLRRTMHELLMLDFDQLSAAVKADEAVQIHNDSSATIGQGLNAPFPKHFFWRASGRGGDSGTPNEPCCLHCDGTYEPLEMRTLSEASSTSPTQISAPPPAIQTESLRLELGAQLAQWRSQRHSAQSNSC